LALKQSSAISGIFSSLTPRSLNLDGIPQIPIELPNGFNSFSTGFHGSQTSNILSHGL